MSAIVEYMMFKLLAEPDLRRLGLGRIPLPATGPSGTTATVTACTTVGPSSSTTVS